MQARTEAAINQVKVGLRYFLNILNRLMPV